MDHTRTEGLIDVQPDTPEVPPITDRFMCFPAICVQLTPCAKCNMVHMAPEEGLRGRTQGAQVGPTRECRD